MKTFELTSDEAEALKMLIALGVANIGQQLAQNSMAANDDGRAISVLSAANSISHKLFAEDKPSE